jgi:hypothetical protein
MTPVEHADTRHIPKRGSKLVMIVLTACSVVLKSSHGQGDLKEP